MKLKSPSRLTTTDYPRIVALWGAAGLHVRPNGRDSQEAFEGQMASGLQTAIGIETESGDLVGIVLATHDGRKGWLNRLAVHPDWRRRGVAKMLIAAAEDALHQQGIDVIAALIEPGNAPSLELFLASGYEEYAGLHYVSKRSRADS
ncbi:MAG: GNAT family N-acetyltransferase [Anaerolineae bacterium]|nr:GNAT family N-acetyltransferase [Anaerolineae bacterium]